MSLLPLAEAPLGIRPDELDFPLFIHVLGAMVMVGALVTAAFFLFVARRDGSVDQLRVGFRTLLYVALPSFIVMRVGAQWIADKQGYIDLDDPPAFIDIGFMTSDVGLLFLLTATIATGLTVRGAGRAAEGGGAAAASRWTTVAAWLTTILIAVYVVAIWAMTAKPA